jgi:adenylate kinase
MYEAYLLFGAPGSGKGTQGKILGTVPRFFHLACGDVFRSLDTRSPLGKEFLAYSSRGELVPDPIVMDLWHAYIAKAERSGQFKPDIDRLVLDGIPRNVVQAEMLADKLDVKRVFHLYCPDRDELVVRLRKRALKDNRLDDANDAVIVDRLATYDRETRPVLEYYGEKLVMRIDATQAPILVTRDIVSAVSEECHAPV